MPLRIELQSSDSGPGYADLTASGWRGAEAPAEISVQRNQDGRFLGDDGDWTTSPVWHGTDLTLNDGQVSGLMGSWLVDPLVHDTTLAYMMEMRGPDHGDKGVVRMRGQILSSAAAGSAPGNDQRTRHASAPVVEPVVVAPPPAPEPVVPPEPPPPPPPPPPPQPKPVGGSKTTLIMVAVAILVLGAVAAWWLLKDGQDAGSPAAAPATAPAAAGPSGPCTANALAETKDDLAFVQACVRSMPEADATLAVIEAAKSAKRCDVAQRLYAHQAQSGDARIALAYAREYDPDTFKQGGCIDAADAETAIYWYETVLSKETDNATAKQRLESLRK